jgi:hypothetical protein
VSMLCGLHPCALSGPYRPRGAHGFWTLLVHFSGKSASFGGKLSDRIVREFLRAGGGLAMSATRESKLFSCGAGGAYDSRVAPGHVMCAYVCCASYALPGPHADLPARGST